MADPLLSEPPPPDLSFDDFAAEFNNLPIPSMDSLFPANNDDASSFPSDFDLGFDGDFEITFEDLDDIYIPSNLDEFLLQDAAVTPPLQIHDDHYSDANSECKPISDVPRFSNLQSSPPVSLDDSGDQNSNQTNEAKVLSFQSHESDSSDRESSGGLVSSQGSGNVGSGVCEVMNSPSPHSAPYDRGFSSHVIVDENIKLEGIGKSCDLKRKIDHNEGNIEAKTNKHRKSSTVMENAAQECGLSPLNEEDEKRKSRLMRNRESAQLSRQRKKQYVEELEEKVRSMHSTITDLSSKISFVMAENATLKQQLSAGGMCPAPPPGMYTHPPMPPMPYPFVPYAPYVVKPHGSQVPVVPIPRLKSQQPASVSKNKKSERKKSEGKTKKVASISFLGLLFFILLFGGLVPLVDVKFGGIVDDVSGRSRYVSDRFYSQHGGKVWPVIGSRNGSGGDKGVGFSSGRFGIPDRITNERGRKLGEERHNQQDPQHRSGSDEFVHMGNSSEPLVASLYVPRNDKLVKIDGNLIINSILASEKAMAFQTADIAKNDERETALAIPEVGTNRGPHPHFYRSLPEQRKALASGSAETLKNHLKSTASDGNMQQWFREGIAAVKVGYLDLVALYNIWPMLSSGMCKEVFRFDVSPTPGAIVPASSVANVSSDNNQNATSLNKSRNRRILHRLPLGINGSEEHGGQNLLNDKLQGNNSKSSMVVSVLVDPKEAGDVDIDGMITPRSLSRIFVVVLVDSIKYVTYSCGLPHVPPPLVTA
ncbi:bZIP transcription factor 17 [Senna tora]|uniref:BZIP transcription factor 17 n=1 Tax=Senna tora TaxID=362788 RepID=A0A834W006_9FABA|nr:bZIP transcription factor 17 [Senna tora]